MILRIFNNEVTEGGMEYISFGEIEEYVGFLGFKCKAQEKELKLVLVLTRDSDSREYGFNHRLRRKCNGKILSERIKSICEDIT